MRGRIARFLPVFAVLSLGAAGCTVRGDDVGPIDSDEIIHTRGTVGAPFASVTAKPVVPAQFTPPAVTATASATATPTASAEVPPPAPPVLDDTMPGDPFSVGQPHKKPLTIMRAGEVKVAGSLDADTAKRKIRAAFGAFRKCFADARKADAKLTGGKYAYELAVDAKGVVTDVKEGDGTLKDAKAKSCLSDELKKVAFAAASDNKASKVTGDFTFAATHATVNKKDIDEATIDDVKDALKAAGYTDITVDPAKKGPAVIHAKIATKKVALTFVPAKHAATDPVPDDTLKAGFLSNGIVFDDGAYLAIVFDPSDQLASETLYEALFVTEPVTP